MNMFMSVHRQTLEADHAARARMRAHDMQRAMRSEAYMRYVGEVNSEAPFMGPQALSAFQGQQIQTYREAMGMAGVQPQ